MTSGLRVFLFAGFSPILVGIVLAVIGVKSVFYYAPIVITKPDRDTTVFGARIRYRQYGKGDPTLILLHGFGGSLGEWRKIMQVFPNNRTIALDLIGFGGSDRPTISYSLETQRKYLEAFMEKLDIKKAILAGRSMGASVAAWTASHSKEKIVGLILIAPSAYPGSLSYPWPLSSILKPGMPNQIAAIAVNNSIFRWFFPDSLLPQAISVTDSYDDEFASALGDIQQPTLLIWSRGDRTVPFNYSTAYRDKIPKLTFVELPDFIGHSVTMKYSSELVKLFKDFINHCCQT
jgi:pimeloyl-ACP methyl ester carboxylesterase